MHVILVSMGTDGDLLPFVGLGVALRSRGHRVTVAGPEPYSAMALQHGLEFRSLVSKTDTEKFLNNPNLWHPVKSGIHAARWGARLIRNQYEVLQQLAIGEDTLLVSNAGVVAARLVQETCRKPMATILLQPGLLPSVHEPPVMPVLPIPSWMPRWMRCGYWRMVDVAGGMLIGRSLNRIRKSIGLAPVQRFFRWWLSPELVIGMFPDWYAAPQPDWPPQLRLVGFPQFDGGTNLDLPNDLVEFCDSRAPPIAFTFGTGMMHGKDLYREAVEACSRLNRRGILLTRYTEQLPTPLPAFIRHVSFASFQKLFPLCSVIVHHGGVGTTARAIAAGKPQVVLPLAWDQPDNSARVCRLGVATSIPIRLRNASRLAVAIAEQLKPEVQSRCRALFCLFEKTNAFELAADLFEELHEFNLNQ